MFDKPDNNMCMCENNSEHTVASILCQYVIQSDLNECFMIFLFISRAPKRVSSKTLSATIPVVGSLDTKEKKGGSREEMR